jgi:hypothetical protein
MERGYNNRALIDLDDFGDIVEVEGSAVLGKGGFAAHLDPLARMLEQDGLEGIAIGAAQYAFVG